MSFPIQFWDLIVWLATTSTILFLTSEMLSPSYGKSNIYINNKRLKNAAKATLVLFLITVAIRMISAVFTE
jgi:hypothetical protein